MDNYTGPYWSDGKLQESVEFGKTAPTSELDAASRLHDSAYAKYKDYGHRTAADQIYGDTNSGNGTGRAIIATGAIIGNQFGEAISDIWDFKSLGPLGIIVGGLEYIYNAADYDLNSNKYKEEVLAYYATDPGWEGRGEAPNDAIGTKAKVSKPIAVSFPQDFGRVENSSGFKEILSYTYNPSEYGRPSYYFPGQEFGSGGGRRKKRSRFKRNYE